MSLPRPILLAALLSLALSLAPPCPARANGNGQPLTRLVQDGGLLVSKNGAVIYARNEEKLFVPASVLKIGTGLAAIRILGPEYRFRTEFFLTPDQDLVIRGLADPFLVSEEVSAMARGLRSRGLAKVRHIHLDDSACRLERGTDGAGASLNPYDAQSGCLAVNFNTVHVEVEKNGRVRSAEEQTPLLPIMAELARGLAPGSHRINVTASGDRSLRYAGELFAAILAREGVEVTGRIRTGPLPAAAPFHVHVSGRGLDEIVAGLLFYSNNFIANQLFLAAGAARFGWPATWDKGRDAMTGFYRDELNLSGREITVVEGSGLSRQNRLSPKAMLAILEAFKPHAHLLPLDKGRRLKSGTLTGVYAYAGYFPAANGGLDPFVLILNQPRNTRDRVLELLHKMQRNNSPLKNGLARHRDVVLKFSRP